MNPTTVHNQKNSPDHSPVIVVRQAIEALNALDEETANYLNALAFVLMRVARADGRVCADERLRMEEILFEHTRISAEHAVLVTEIACHRAGLADCGCSYSISRELRMDLDRTRRQSIVGLLLAVANADGCFSTVEHREVEQLAGELGIDLGEVFDRE